MPKYMEFKEIEIVSYYSLTLYITKIGYLLKGPNINEMHSNILSAIVSMAEYISRLEVIKEGDCDIDKYIHRIKEIYIGIMKRIRKDIMVNEIGQDRLLRELEQTHDIGVVLDEK